MRTGKTGSTKTTVRIPFIARLIGACDAGLRLTTAQLVIRIPSPLMEDTRRLIHRVAARGKTGGAGKGKERNIHTMTRGMKVLARLMPPTQTTMGIQKQNQRKTTAIHDMGRIANLLPPKLHMLIRVRRCPHSPSTKNVHGRRIRLTPVSAEYYPDGDGVDDDGYATAVRNSMAPHNPGGASSSQVEQAYEQGKLPST